MADTPLTISTILSEDLLLSIAPYLHPKDISALSLTNKLINNLLTSAQGVYRHIDFSPEKKKFQNAQKLVSPTILSATRTLVLDFTLVAIPQLESILYSSNITLLSIRGCKGIDERALMAHLSPERGTKLKGIYYFTDPAPTTSRFVQKSVTKFPNEWALVISNCKDICFDTRVCRGLKHQTDEVGHIEPRISDVKLEGGCSGCGVNLTSEGLPNVLVAPAPLHSSTIRVACKGIDGKPIADVLRCEMCVRERWCEGCGKWWCESCAVDKKHVTRPCLECGFQCGECIAAVTLFCQSCKSGYCTTHNEGADDIQCEWCKASSARRGASATASNAFLTSAAASHYAMLRLTRPGNTFVKSPAGASYKGGIGGRNFQNETIARRRALMNN
ncbi:unnamed protein product [Tuber melanosporum]|uniref:(Perigord truffle) hypothetical protein n=1 Tax=Tuber melanosporum (strain Mel28) TaxID=656061 RepID=D5GIG5_TUBMM|nr:uncharacterized protein GSTUM_00008489001 [Tuber melanosporum]CAZ84308.1 unnamed protein product [Tuber melanosporum]